ncbi:hypothetical protein EAI_15785 [Harpegnathos saltator]|uniref:Uncharacterized protein n=1 Tax=Harpegnathos saltator TaxID=610380 RepID=E2C2B6_HARSA|nr:hypothetical protein EAI_15785 [Harpegnathos saltator]
MPGRRSHTRWWGTNQDDRHFFFKHGSGPNTYDNTYDNFGKKHDMKELEVLPSSHVEDAAGAVAANQPGTSRTARREALRSSSLEQLRERRSTRNLTQRAAEATRRIPSRSRSRTPNKVVVSISPSTLPDRVESLPKTFKWDIPVNEDEETDDEAFAVKALCTRDRPVTTVANADSDDELDVGVIEIEPGALKVNLRDVHPVKKEEKVRTRENSKQGLRITQDISVKTKIRNKRPEDTREEGRLEDRVTSMVFKAMVMWTSQGKDEQTIPTTSKKVPIQRPSAQ